MSDSTKDYSLLKPSGKRYKSVEELMPDSAFPPEVAAKRLAGLLEAHGMTAADFGRLLELEPSMGSKIINGSRQLTAAHIRRLSAHFALPAEYFL